MLNNIVDKLNNVGSKTLFKAAFNNPEQVVRFSKCTLIFLHSKNRTTCSGLLKTALNNVLLPTLFNVVNNIVQPCYT